MGKEFDALLKKWSGRAAARSGSDGYGRGLSVLPDTGSRSVLDVGGVGVGPGRARVGGGAGPREAGVVAPGRVVVPRVVDTARRSDGAPVEVAIRMNAAVRIPLDVVVYPEGFIERLKKRFTLPWAAGKWMMGRRPLGDQPAAVNLFYEWDAPRGRELVLPRGGVRLVLDYFQAAGYRVVVGDDGVSVPIRGVSGGPVGLTARHRAAADVFVGKRFGILYGAGGNDVFPVLAEVLARRRQRTLVVVKTRDRMYLWKAALERLMPGAGVGLVGDYHDDLLSGVKGGVGGGAGFDIIIGIDKSLYKRGDEIRDRFGCLVVDRCHLANPKIFFTLVWQCSARYLIGVATGPAGADPGRFPLLFLGDVVRLPRAGVGEGPDPADRVRVQVVPTDFYGVDSVDYAGVLSALSADDVRNQLIIGDVLRISAANPGGRVVVTAARLDQLEWIREGLMKNYRKSVLVSRAARPGPNPKQKGGGLPPASECPVVLVTHKGITSLEVEPVVAVVVAAPFKYRPVAAAISRMLAPGGVVVEYRDQNKLLVDSLERRLAFYRGIGLIIE